MNYSKEAAEKGVYIIGSCGFDSIPADMGVLYTRDQFKGTHKITHTVPSVLFPTGIATNFTLLHSALSYCLVLKLQCVCVCVCTQAL